MNEDKISIFEHYNGNSNLRRQQLYTLNVFGNRVLTTVTCIPSVVSKWVYKILHHHRCRRDRLVVGLGVQWLPTSSREVATLQLCVGRRCLIFQIKHANFIPGILKSFLSDDSNTFVGVRNYSDSKLLKRHCNLKVKRILELGSVAGLKDFSMEALASIFLGFDGINKWVGTGGRRWDYRRLSRNQVQYACVDVYLSFEIGKELKAWNYER